MKELKDLTENQFNILKKSGMLWELYPDALENYGNIKKKKLVVMNVIGGLEGKETVGGNSPIDEPPSNVIHSEENCHGISKMIGHNQLCNRQVEVDRKELNKTIANAFIGSKNSDCEDWVVDVEQAISKAIEQGKVIKVVK